MELAVTQQEGYYLAVTDGPLDETTEPPFRDALHPLLAEKGTKVVIDLSGSKWINSDGLAALVRLVKDASKQQCRVIYASPSPFVREILEITRLETYFEVAPTRDDAVEVL